jgi:hypothetical protein
MVIEFLSYQPNGGVLRGSRVVQIIPPGDWIKIFAVPSSDYSIEIGWNGALPMKTHSMIEPMVYKKGPLNERNET